MYSWYLSLSFPIFFSYIRREKIGKRYDYNDNEVYQLLNKNYPRKTVIYARVSTRKQKKDLENQIELLKNWCHSNGYKINEVYKDIASEINFDDRIEFFKLLDEVMEYKIDKVIITYKDRLSRVGFNFFKKLFGKFGTEIIVISEVNNEKLEADEVMGEITSLIQCFSMKLYTKRKGKSLEVGYNETNWNIVNRHKVSIIDL